MGQRIGAGTKRSPWKREVTPNRSTARNGRGGTVGGGGCCAATAEVSKSGDVGRRETIVGPCKAVVGHSGART